MATAKTTRMDAQGRVILPPHIRKELNLNPGQMVTVSLEGDTIKIQPAEKRCVFCGNSVKEGSNITLGDNHICGNCAQAVARILNVKEATA